jgi:hypothetical protein
MSIVRTTSQIQYEHWTTIQLNHSAAMVGGNAVSDNAGTANPKLIFENGIYKYPTQANAKVTIPRTTKRPLRLVTAMGHLSVAGNVTLTIYANPNDTSDAYYPAADAGHYAESNIVIYTGAAITDFAEGFNTAGNTRGVIIHPGQGIGVTTTQAAVVRLTFGLCVDGY